jgi:hypothetical protein
MRKTRIRTHSSRDRVSGANIRKRYFRVSASQKLCIRSRIPSSWSIVVVPVMASLTSSMLAWPPVPTYRAGTSVVNLREKYQGERSGGGQWWWVDV